MCVLLCVLLCVCACVLINYLPATETTTRLARTGGCHKSGTFLNCKEGTVLCLHVCAVVCAVVCVCVT